jgi:transposase-like protein
MEREERQRYNKEYYSKHKTEIMSKLCEKIECEFCHRKVIRNNLISHQQKPICKRKAELIKQNELRKRDLEIKLV